MSQKLRSLSFKDIGQDIITFVGGVLFLAGLVTLQIVTEKGLRKVEAVWIEPPASQENKWHPELFKALSFGHLSTAIDSLWLRTLQDDGISHVPAGVHPRAYYDLDLATDLDPGFFELYVSGGNLLAVIRDDDEGALALLEKGLKFYQEGLSKYPEKFQEKYWKYAWEVPLLLAYVHLFEFNNLPKAAEAFKIAADIEGAPAYLESLKTRLEQPGGEYDVGLRILNFMIDSAQGDLEKNSLKRKRDSLLLAQYLHQLNESFRAYLRRLPEYRSSQEITSSQMDRFWNQYKEYQRVPDRDPWGGRIRLDSSGRIVTTTPYEPVFGLE